MSDSIKYATFRGSPTGEIIPAETTRPLLTADEVLVSVSASGLCGGDLIFKKNDMVLGHEGVGVVAAVGPAVKRLKKGDRVGWGFLQDSCGNCTECLDGTEVFCPERKMYGTTDLDQGSFATGMVKREDRLLQIPDALSDEEAAPLMCAGATVFNALDTYAAKPTQTIGVIGIGGLGHLAIQFASKMGLEVIAFSSSNDKEEEAKSFGASAVYQADQVPGLKLARSLNLLFVTTPKAPELGPYLALLAPRAAIFPLTIGPGDVQIPRMPMLMKGISIQGSLVCPRNSHKRMLAFAARHNIKPQLQRFNMDKAGIEEGFGILASGKMRYRGVLVVPADRRIAV